eukprot:TRINITY_DN2995_c0_g3_i2.p1 TRINITY_DN2995_c0_g3~~TRINITY_DN2995_c0_g3_i2.p1  ORF type:complete len:463 (+),score=79.50 TRINITY_DN2995_c0_g3_i2:601-1989(+)
MRIGLLAQMFSEVPEKLENDNDFLTNMTDDDLALRMLVDFKDIQDLLITISDLQLMQLCDTMLPTNVTPQQQYSMIQEIRSLFLQWDFDQLDRLMHLVNSSPVHRAKHILKQSVPGISMEMVLMLVPLIHLGKEEMFSFKKWVEALTANGMIFIVNLMQMESDILLDIKRRLSSRVKNGVKVGIKRTRQGNKVNEHSSEFINALDNEEIKRSAPANKKRALGNGINTNYPLKLPFSFLDEARHQLRIHKQPPAQTVYQRILRPFPVVMLVGPSETEAVNFFVETTLLREDNGSEIPLCLDGTTVMRFTGGSFCTFKKLKILSTSQQQGTKFRLRFQLKQYVGSIFQIVEGATIESEPIEVFSHTCYLTKSKKNSKKPAKLIEVLPNTAYPGERVAILGENFVKGKKLTINFGDIKISPQFHEMGTLTCTVPDGIPNSVVTIKVTNDGKTYDTSEATFTFMAP